MPRDDDTSMSQTDRQTDRQTTYDSNTALALRASRRKNTSKKYFHTKLNIQIQTCQYCHLTSNYVRKVKVVTPRGLYPPTPMTQTPPSLPFLSAGGAS